MNDTLLQTLITKTATSGPFTDFKDDQVILPELLQWIGDDWQRLRSLLNFIYDRGEEHGCKLAIREIVALKDQSAYRIKSMWLQELQHDKRD